MLIAGWLIFGLAFLFMEAGVLTQLVGGNEKYVSPLGALKYDLAGSSLASVTETWPWSQVSIAEIIDTAGADAVKGVGKDVFKGVTEIINPTSGQV